MYICLVGEGGPWVQYFSFEGLYLDKVVSNVANMCLKLNIYQGGKCPWGKCPWGKCPWGKCPGGKCPGGKCPGGKCPGGKCPGGKCRGGG